MATFTQLAPAELAALAEVYGIGAVEDVRAIAAGTINSNFELRTASGHYFLRVNEGKQEADVAWEARLVGELAARGVQTPAPLVARDGKPYAALAGHGKWASAFAWRAGRHLAADEVTAAHAGELGAALARLHVAGLALPSTWQRASIYDHDHLVARFATFRAGRDPELAPAIIAIDAELARAAAAAATRAAATHGIIHGDLFRDNVLWAGSQIAALLDFEQASGGSLAYDLAVVINDWCWATAPVPAPRLDLAAALLAGYAQVRPLPSADRAALPIEVRAAAARFTITRITDVYLARVPNPEKDFRAFLARLDAWCGPALGELTRAL